MVLTLGASTTVAIPTIENCYNAGELQGSNIETAIIGYGTVNYLAQGKILNCFLINKGFHMRTHYLLNC